METKRKLLLNESENLHQLEENYFDMLVKNYKQKQENEKEMKKIKQFFGKLVKMENYLLETVVFFLKNSQNSITVCNIKQDKNMTGFNEIIKKVHPLNITSFSPNRNITKNLTTHFQKKRDFKNSTWSIFDKKRNIDKNQTLGDFDKILIKFVTNSLRLNYNMKNKRKISLIKKGKNMRNKKKNNFTNLKNKKKVHKVSTAKPFTKQNNNTENKLAEEGYKELMSKRDKIKILNSENNILKGDYDDESNENGCVELKIKLPYKLFKIYLNEKFLSNNSEELNNEKDLLHEKKLNKQDILSALISRNILSLIVKSYNDKLFKDKSNSDKNMVRNAATCGKSKEIEFTPVLCGIQKPIRCGLATTNAYFCKQPINITKAQEDIENTSISNLADTPVRVKATINFHGQHLQLNGKFYLT